MTINKNTESEVDSSREKGMPEVIATERIGVGKKVITALSALALSFGISGKPQDAKAEGVRYAQSAVSAGTITDSISAGGKYLGDIPTTQEEIMGEIEENRIIADFMRLRQSEYYAPYIEQFQQLSKEDQLLVANAIYPEGSVGGEDIPQEIIDLVHNSRVPLAMKDAILDEATASGADPDWDIPAFDEALMELRETGTTGSTTLTDVFTFSSTARGLYIVIAYNDAQAENAAAQAENAAAQAENAAAQAENAAAQAENAAEIDRGEDLDIIGAQQEEILGN